MYIINYYSIQGRRGAALRKAPRAARIAEIIIGDETRRYERNEKNGWRRTA